MFLQTYTLNSCNITPKNSTDKTGLIVFNNSMMS